MLHVPRLDVQASVQRYAARPPRARPLTQREARRLERHGLDARGMGIYAADTARARTKRNLDAAHPLTRRFLEALGIGALAQLDQVTPNGESPGITAMRAYLEAENHAS